MNPLKLMTILAVTAADLSSHGQGQPIREALEPGAGSAELIVPAEYFTLFPTWQRGFIVDDRLIHAAGDNGILLALFSSAMDQPVGRETRVMLPFTHLDSDARIPGRPGPAPSNSINPTMPPLLHVWDVDNEHLLLVFARMKPDHDYWARLYRLSSIGGPIVEVLSAYRAAAPQETRPEEGDNQATRLDLIGPSRTSWRQTIPDAMLRMNREMHFSLRLMPQQRLELLTQRLGFPHLLFVQMPPDLTKKGSIWHWPDYQPEPFHHVVIRGEHFLLRSTGPLGRIPQQVMKPSDAHELRKRSSAYRLDPINLSHLQRGDPLDPVADFSRDPDWLASDPETHFMVQDRDQDMVRFFWGVSGYAELEVVDEAPAGAANPADDQVRVRFEQLPAPPEMENVRTLLLNPPEFERPEVYYEPFEGDTDTAPR